MSKPMQKNTGRDDTTSAPESGEPAESGRNRGQVVMPPGTAEQQKRKVVDQSGGTGEEFESGRQDATPRSGA